MMSNKLIAEFMSIEVKNDDAYLDEVKAMRKSGIHIDFNGYTTSELKYHTSWDWLMPVVERINDLTDDWGNTNDFTIGNGFVWVDPHIGDRIFFSGNNPEDKKEPMISKVYRGAVKFIEQYTIIQNQDNDTNENE